MPVWDQEMLRSHVINDELRNINSNVFQKAIDQDVSLTRAWLNSLDFDRRL